MVAQIVGPIHTQSAFIQHHFQTLFPETSFDVCEDCKIEPIYNNIEMISNFKQLNQFLFNILNHCRWEGDRQIQLKECQPNTQLRKREVHRMKSFFLEVFKLFFPDLVFKSSFVARFNFGQFLFPHAICVAPRPLTPQLLVVSGWNIYRERTKLVQPPWCPARTSHFHRPQHSYVTSHLSHSWRSIPLQLLSADGKQPF